MNPIYTLRKYHTKTASEEQPTFPISRALATLSDLFSLGLTRYIYDRALQGRVNTGYEAPSLLQSEKVLMKTMSPEKNNKTYPISRFLTAIPTATVVGGLAADRVAAILGKNRPLSAFLGALGSAGTAALIRDIYARDAIGKANAGSTPIFYRTADQINAFKGTKLTSEDREKMRNSLIAENALAIIPRILNKSI